ncbi:MAG: hypothetical protein K1X89_20820 [Myxococcaceae bacterium]|nr:hypothetical protein [Myxococcaceae bacterium]
MLSGLLTLAVAALATPDFAVDEGVRGCPGAEGFAAKAGERAAPFADGSTMRIRVSANDGGLRAGLVRLKDGAALGERTLELATPDCERLVQAILLALDLARLEPAPRRPVPATGALALAPEPAPLPLGVRVEGGGSASVGQAFGPSVGGQADVQLRAGAALLSLGFFADAWSTQLIADGAVRGAALGGTVGAGRRVVGTLDVSAVFAAGVWRAEAFNLPGAKSSRTPYLAVGPRVEWSVAVNGTVSLVLRGEVWAALTRTVYVAGDETVAQTPPVGARAAVLLAFDFGDGWR